MNNYRYSSRTSAEMISKISGTFNSARKHASAWSMALLVSSVPMAFADENSSVASIIGASADAQGVGVDYGQKIAAIDAKISNTKTQILALEQKGMEALSDDEFDQLFILQDALIELENQKQNVLATQLESEKQDTRTNAEAIDNYDRSLENFEQIKAAIEG